MRALLAAMWLGGGGLGLYTYFKHRSYVRGLPPDPVNDALRNKFRTRLFWSVLSIAMGVWWAFSLLRD
jgi:hypothetical protein